MTEAPAQLRVEDVNVQFGGVQAPAWVTFAAAPAEGLRDNADVREFYLGLTEMGQQRSYRDVKHYTRRKRWLS